MGRLTALRLHRLGYEICLFDKDDRAGSQSAAYAAAGLLTPYGESLHAERNIVAMGLESLSLWPKILDTLEGYTFFQRQGSILISHEQDQGDFLRFRRHLQQAYPECRAEHLDRQGLQALEPELARRFHQGLYLPQEGQIGNRKLLTALGLQLELEGVDWRTESRVTRIENHQTGSRVEVNGQILDYDLVIDCRGLGAKASSIKNLDMGLERLRGVRGELFQLFAPEVSLTRPIRLMHPRYQLYVAPKPKGYFVVGATEIESEDTGPMTVRSAMELLSAAYSVHPGFAEAQIRQHLSQLRPAFDDNQPQIRVQGSTIQVNGLYRHGFLIAPVLLEQIEQTVQQINGQRQVPTSYQDWIAVTYHPTPTAQASQDYDASTHQW